MSESSSGQPEPPAKPYRSVRPTLRADIHWSDGAREVRTGYLKYVTMETLMRQGARATFFITTPLLPLPDPLESKSTFVVDINVVSDEEIQQLNQQYRDQDKPTDVLSFSQLEEKSGDAGKSTFTPIGEKVLLGDIVISLATAQRQAEEEGHPLPEEMAFLTVHAMLHLLGYDHMNAADKAIMWEKQNAIMERICKWPPNRKR